MINRNKITNYPCNKLSEITFKPNLDLLWEVAGIHFNILLYGFTVLLYHIFAPLSPQPLHYSHHHHHHHHHQQQQQRQQNLTTTTSTTTTTDRITKCVIVFLCIYRLMWWIQLWDQWAVYLWFACVQRIWRLSWWQRRRWLLTEFMTLLTLFSPHVNVPVFHATSCTVPAMGGSSMHTNNVWQQIEHATHVNSTLVSPDGGKSRGCSTQ